MREGHSLTISWQQCPNDIDDRATHAGGTELRGCKDNELRLSLRDGIRYSNLMQARIRPRAGIDLAQVLDVASNEITAPRRGGPDRWRGCNLRYRNRQADRLERNAGLTHEQFNSPIARAGDWGVELLVSQAGVAFEPVRLAVTVTEVASTPSVGSDAPRSRNLIARDVKNLRQIDTSPRPDPRLHQVRIADAIAQGKPQLIVFATPQFCTSRMCGPVVDIVRTLLPTYGKRVAFTHQEIWQDFAHKKVFPTVEEWWLDTEPWVFVVDRDGIIRAKLEGLVTAHELDIALQGMLKLNSARHP